MAARAYLVRREPVHLANRCQQVIYNQSSNFPFDMFTKLIHLYLDSYIIVVTQKQRDAVHLRWMKLMMHLES